MSDGSRWDRWDRRPYRVLAAALLVTGLVARFLPLERSSTGVIVAAVVSILAAFGGILLLVSIWRRGRREMEEEIRRDPKATAAPSLDQRLDTIDHPHGRWVLAAALAVAAVGATGRMVFLAVDRQESSYWGGAVLLFIPAAFFAWLAWRTRALLRR